MEASYTEGSEDHSRAAMRDKCRRDSALRKEYLLMSETLRWNRVLVYNAPLRQVDCFEGVFYSLKNPKSFSVGG